MTATFASTQTASRIPTAQQPLSFEMQASALHIQARVGYLSYHSITTWTVGGEGSHGAVAEGQRSAEQQIRLGQFIPTSTSIRAARLASAAAC